MIGGDTIPVVLAWLATYFVHSTVLLGLAWFLTRPARRPSPRFVERAWKVGVVGPLLTATVASLLPHTPLLGAFSLSGVPLAETARVDEAEPRDERPAPFESIDSNEPEEAEDVAAPAPPATETPAEGSHADASPSPPADAEDARERTRTTPRVDSDDGELSAEELLVERLRASLRAREESREDQVREPRPRERDEPAREDRADEPSPWFAASVDDAKPGPARRTGRETLGPAYRPERDVRVPARTADPEPATEREVAAAITPEAEAGLAPGEPLAGEGETAVPLAARIRAWSDYVPRPTWGELTLALWTTPALVLAAALLFSALRLSWELRRRHAVQDAALLARFDRLRRDAGVRRTIRLTWSRDLRGPITFGLLRPEIALPVRALDGMRPAHERSMFAHELAHVVRRDPFWFTALAALERVLFFQPLLRLARKRLVDVAEERSDDLAVRWTGDRVALASCLAEIARWILEGNRPQKARALPVAGMASSRLGHRIERLLVPEKGEEPPQRWFAPAAAALLVTTASAAPRVASELPEAQPEPTPPVLHVSEGAQDDEDEARPDELATPASRAAPVPPPAATTGPTDAPEPPAEADAVPAAPPVQASDPLADSSVWSEYTLLEQELELLHLELDLFRSELGPQASAAMRETLAHLDARLRGLDAMRVRARDILSTTHSPNTSFASTPRAQETALETPQR